MDKKNIISRACRINELQQQVYREAFDEMFETANELGISKVVFCLHKDLSIDIPNLVFENVGSGSKSEFRCEELSEIVFYEDYIVLRGSEGSSAYMDRYWGDYFNVEKVGEVYKAFMSVVGFDDLKPRELK